MTDNEMSALNRRLDRGEIDYREFFDAIRPEYDDEQFERVLRDDGRRFHVAGLSVIVIQLCACVIMTIAKSPVLDAAVAISMAATVGWAWWGGLQAWRAIRVLRQVREFRHESGGRR